MNWHTKGESPVLRAMAATTPISKHMRQSDKTVIHADLGGLRPYTLIRICSPKAKPPTRPRIEACSNPQVGHLGGTGRLTVLAGSIHPDHGQLDT